MVARLPPSSFCCVTGTDNCVWLSSQLLTVSNLTIRASGPQSLHTSLCRAANCTGSRTTAEATKPVLMEREGGGSPWQSSTKDTRGLQTHQVSWFNSLTLIFQYPQKVCNLHWQQGDAFPMNATCFPCTEKITILGNHLTVRMAGRNELLPDKHRS